VKNKDKISSYAKIFETKDDPKVTEFLKNNESFKKMAMNIHDWSEGGKRNEDSKMIGNREVSKGPESKGFKKRE
jgi:hypothetical protein